MHPLYSEFLSLLDNGKREKAVEFCLSHLDDKSIDIVSLYQDVLAPALNDPSYGDEEGEVNIWEEHIRTSIVRTIIECCYPRIVKERAETINKKVLVLCPSDEAHEVGARMIADFFLLCGFDVTFIGSSTPGEEISDMISYFKPDYVAVSVTNAYNLLAANKAITGIMAMKKQQGFKLILGGRACKLNAGVCHRLKADMILDTFDDIRRMAMEENDAAV